MINKIRHCYELALVGKRPFSTRLVIEFEVLPSGNVAWAKARRSHHNRLASCVVNVFKRWRFDQRSDSATVSYPFVFRPVAKHVLRRHEVSDLPAGRYAETARAIAAQFGLKRRGPAVTTTVGSVFCVYQVGGAAVELGWDRWSGFSVTAITAEAEPLVGRIAAFMAAEGRRRPGQVTRPSRAPAPSR